MSWHLANPALLLGLLGVGIPVIIHLLNRRRAVVVDWGAMMFLELGRRARRKFQLTEILLMAGRMLLLALVAFAVMKPFWTERASAASKNTGASLAGSDPRDIVLIIDDSASMARKVDEKSTAQDAATAWAADFVKRLAPGSSVAVLAARDRVRPVVSPGSFDKTELVQALDKLPKPHGSSDLPAAIAEAFTLLAKGQNPAREVVLLTDGQRQPWRLDEPGRWTLLRELHQQLEKRQGVNVRLWSVPFGSEIMRASGADGAVTPLEFVRGLVPPGGVITVKAAMANSGPEPLTRTVELLVDGKPVPGKAQAVGPVPPGAKTPLQFQTTILEPGSHLLTVRLAPGDDPLEANDEASRPIDVTAALPVLLVDGEPGVEPLSNETDFLHAALAPTGDDAPQVKTTVVKLPEFTADFLKDQSVIVLANVDSLDASQSAAVVSFLNGGGGLLIAPGDRTDVDHFNGRYVQIGTGLMPALLGSWRGEPTSRKPVAHPAPATFNGAVLSPFNAGDSPPLTDADLFFYRVLTPVAKPPTAAVLARLDNGDPWIVERPFGKGRVILFAGPLDAEGGTLPVNPDFVPLVHELVYHLADPASSSDDIHPGERLAFKLAPLPDPDVMTIPVLTPEGTTVAASIERSDDGAMAVLPIAEESGIYRATLPDGNFRYLLVAGDPRESDPTTLASADTKTLSSGWPLAFETDPSRLPGLLLTSGRGGRHSIWRWLVLAALAGLCTEVWLTRRLVQQRGIADMSTAD
jgi:hypothetical protein